MKRTIVCLALVALAIAAAGANNTSQLGYYRFPALYNDTLLFTAEGDLWRVSARGGAAERLTTHPSEESRPAISPDGGTVAFSAAYEGPTEVYTMSSDGGVPTRQTWEGGDNALVVGWTPSQNRYSPGFWQANGCTCGVTHGLMTFVRPYVPGLAAMSEMSASAKV